MRSLLVLLLLLGGCAASNKNVVNSQYAGTSGYYEGLQYNLPARYGTLKLERKIERLSTVSDLSAELIRLRALKKQSDDKLKLAEALKSKAERLVELAVAASVDGDSLSELRTAKARAQDVYETAKTASDKLLDPNGKWKKRYDETVAALENATGPNPDASLWKIDNPKDTLTFTLHGVVGDPDARFAATFPQSWRHSSDHTLEVDEKGLLQNADFVADDGLDNFVVSVASVAGALSYGIGSPERVIATSESDDFNELLTEFAEALEAFEAQLVGEVPSCEIGNSSRAVWSLDAQREFSGFIHEMTIDPFDSASITEFNRTACRLRSNLRFDARQAGTLFSDNFFIENSNEEFGARAGAFSEELYEHSDDHSFQASELIGAPEQNSTDRMEINTNVQENEESDEVVYECVETHSIVRCEEANGSIKQERSSNERTETLYDDAIVVLEDDYEYPEPGSGTEYDSVSYWTEPEPETNDGQSVSMEQISASGIAYRTPIHFTFEIFEWRLAPNQSETVRLVQQSVTDDLPDKSSIAFIVPEKSTFVSQTSGIKFKDGFPIKVDIDQPSQLAAAGGLLEDTLKKPFEFVGEIVKIQLGTGNAEKEIALGQIAVAEKQAEALDKVLASQRANALADIQTDIQLEELAATRDPLLALELARLGNELGVNDATASVEIARLQNQLGLNNATNSAQIAAQILAERRSQIALSDAEADALIALDGADSAADLERLKARLEYLKTEKQVALLEKEIREIRED